MKKFIVPYNDLSLHHKQFEQQFKKIFSHSLENSAFIGGPIVSEFEKRFAEVNQFENCIACANGTDAIEIALRTLGISNGDEVIVPAHTWISTAEAVTAVGGVPVFADLLPYDCNVDPEDIKKKITAKTKAVIAVHLYGQPADIEEIQTICQQTDLYLIEDCAQAIMSDYKGKRVGSFGDMGTFSFYPGKNLGALGDAGALTVKDDDLSIRAKKLTNHGSILKGDHSIEGLNSRLDSLQASFLNLKLEHIHEFTAKRRIIAKNYLRALGNMETLSLPNTQEHKNHSWHAFTIRVQDRDKFINFMKENGVELRVNYPVSLPFLEAYSSKKHLISEFPNAYKFQKEIVSLPIFPEMTVNQTNMVIELTKDFYV